MPGLVLSFFKVFGKAVHLRNEWVELLLNQRFSLADNQIRAALPRFRVNKLIVCLHHKEYIFFLFQRLVKVTARRLFVGLKKVLTELLKLLLDRLASIDAVMPDQLYVVIHDGQSCHAPVLVSFLGHLTKCVSHDRDEHIKEDNQDHECG